MASDQDDVAHVRLPALPPGHLWAPAVGMETRRITFPPGSAERIEREAVNIIAKCNDPRSAQVPRVGLAVGCVQSGKTLNFTTVCALARDNDYQLIFVITGVAIKLYTQSTERLLEQLNIRGRADREIIQLNFDLETQPPSWLRGTLDEWRDASRPRERKTTVIITVLKHHRHLQRLVSILEPYDLITSPALIIDDEADQAGLNSRANAGPGRETTTYRQLVALRNKLPHHTYLQYTATPQALVLINLIDVLSPSFVEVLAPGPGYTGGPSFFRDRVQTAIKDIPQTEIWTTTNPLPSPPPSFRQALASFLICASDGDLKPPGPDNCRSMLIHPHQTTARHSVYFQWATAIRDDWCELLRHPDDPDHAELLQLIETQYEDLFATYPSLLPLDRILSNCSSILSKMNFQEINSALGATPRIEWSHAYAHVLVGGQSMDRGFTVKGLCTTYMPRPLGTGTADTLQQRARFFGYKESYIGLCRVWLEAGVIDAFQAYVEHEESLRQELSRFLQTGRDLHEWKRAFFLDRTLRPTRRQVLSLPFVRLNHADDWAILTRPHHLAETMLHNNRVLQEFSQSLHFAPDLGHPARTLSQQHEYVDNVPLVTIMQLLSELKISDSDDSNTFAALLLELDRELEQSPESTCAIYRMSPRFPRERQRREDSDEVNPHQGANEPVYPGDDQIRMRDKVSIQIHHLSELKPHNTDPTGETFQNIWLVAVYVPASIGRDVVVQ